jgi:anti-sigma regulatory factor (Ser/Thr protein kinase)/RimJ/RimL family protein N-acetyltransferase
MKTKTVSLSLPAEMEYLGVALDCARSVAKRFGFDGEATAKIELAIEEAVSNVVKHGYGLEGDDTFGMVFERTALGMRIRIREKGIPFDPRLLPAWDASKAEEEEKAKGLGVHLMKSVMDEVSFHNLGLEGKETHLVKHLPGRGLEALGVELPKEEEPPQERREPQVIQEKIEYDVRRLDPSEAIEVSRCAYKSHGYTFFDEHIYFPDSLIELNRSGDMISAVAVTKEGTFMGHAALVYPERGAKIAELTFVFVNLEYRGQGCMNRLCDFLFNRVDHGLSGIYAYAVSNHVFTQKVMLKHGFGDCCVELATSPATWEFKGMEQNTQRISVIMSFKYLVPPAREMLYPPPHHREMIEAAYENVGAKHEYAECAAVELPAEESRIDVRVFATENCAEIHLAKPGRHAAREVRAALRDLCVKQVAAIFLMLNLGDPATAHLTAELERLGFFFAGILPQAAVGEALVLQYLNNVAFDYGKVQAYSPMARRLLEYVRERDPNRVG